MATRMIMVITIPLAVGFVLFGRECLSAAYGSKWLPAVGALQILAIYGMLRSLGSTFGIYDGSFEHYFSIWSKKNFADNPK